MQWKFIDICTCIEFSLYYFCTQDSNIQIPLNVSGVCVRNKIPSFIHIGYRKELCLRLFIIYVWNHITLHRCFQSQPEQNWSNLPTSVQTADPWRQCNRNMQYCTYIINTCHCKTPAINRFDGASPCHEFMISRPEEAARLFSPF